MTERKKRTKAKKVTAVKVIPEPIPEALESTGEPSKPDLPPDLQAVVNATNLSPQVRAKMVRWAFATRGWPNKDYTGTVRDFLVEHNIPITNPVK